MNIFCHNCFFVTITCCSRGITPPGYVDKEPLPLSSVRSTGIKETIMLKGLVLWAMGVPLVVIVLLYMFFF